MGVSMEKIALVLGTVAFQLYVITFAMTNYRSAEFESSEDDAIQALLITAFLLFVAGVILLLLMNFSGMDGKIMALLTLVIYLAAAACAVAGAAIYADDLPEKTTGYAYSLTAYITGAACAVAAAVFLMMKICCGRCCGD